MCLWYEAAYHADDGHQKMLSRFECETAMAATLDAAMRLSVCLTICVIESCE